MCNVVQLFPDRKISHPPATELTDTEIISRVRQLVWEDAKTFFALMVFSISPYPLEIKPEMLSRIQSYGLIDDSGQLTENVKNIVAEVAHSIGSSLLEAEGSTSTYYSSVG